MIKRILLIFMVLSSLLFSFAAAANTLMICNIPKEQRSILANAGKLNPTVLRLALKAYDCAIQSNVKVKKDILTIIDFSLPSTVKRLWVINLKSKKILFHLHVAHGKNTGELIAKYFSNISGSEKSSLGLYLTQSTFIGNDDYSMRIKGLDVGFNNLADQRLIVVHGAWYISPNFITRNHRLGRSWGCPAVNKGYIKQLINTIKDGTLIFAYDPHTDWLLKSKFLHCKLKLDKENIALKPFKLLYP